jgi:hypothetical protein
MIPSMVGEQPFRNPFTPNPGKVLNPPQRIAK